MKPEKAGSFIFSRFALEYHVQHGFVLEYIIVENILKCLVCVVDQKLLKGVDVETFESENVQNTNHTIMLVTRCECTVHYAHNVSKDAIVQFLRECISSCDGLFYVGVSVYMYCFVEIGSVTIQLIRTAP